jgi:hypothetical protein
MPSVVSSKGHPGTVILRAPRYPFSNPTTPFAIASVVISRARSASHDLLGAAMPLQRSMLQKKRPS